MNKELKLKDVWYWGSNFALLGTASLSMYLDNPIPMLLVALPLIMLDRAYFVPVLMFIACIEGSFSSEDSSSQAESWAIMALTPIFIFDFFHHNKVKVPTKFVIIFIVFLFFVLFGAIVYKMHPYIQSSLIPVFGKKAVSSSALYIKIVMKTLKLGFFFMYLKTLINKDKTLLYRSLTIIKDLAPYLMFCILVDMVLFGARTSQFDTLHFGEAKHGDFTANLCALGIFLYVGIFEEKTSWFKRMANLAGLGFLLYMIMELASRNGLLCFILIAGFGGLMAIWNRNVAFKTTLIVTAVSAFVVVLYLFKDSPTIERLIYYQEERAGGDRLAYWLGGALALEEEPLFGLGGDESSSAYAVGKYGTDVTDHVMHNTFLEFAVEYGLIGVAFYICFVCLILYHSYKNFMFAMKYNNMLIAVPSVSYFISIFAGLFVSRVWESTLWYNTLLVFAVYVLFRMPVEKAVKNRKAYLIHGLPDPMLNPSLAIQPG